MLWVWQAEALEEAGGLPVSRSFTHGYGIFETMLGFAGGLVAADRHLRRLGEGCSRLGLPMPSEAIVPAIEGKLGAGRRRVRLQVGDGGMVVVAIEDAGPVPESVVVRSSPWVRNERSPVAGIKCCSYADNLVALDWARRRGADELLFANTRGELCEAAMANVFLVEAGRVVTPPLASGCLPGTARERVLELDPSASEEPLPMERLGSADELFLTSATRGVVPVVDIDGRELGPGERTLRLREAFAARWFCGGAPG